MNSSAVGIKAQNVSMQYSQGGPLILDDICLEIAPGEFIAFLGPSGCGKTTMLSIISGLLKQTGGNLQFTSLVNGISGIADKPKLGMVFQEPRLLPWKTVKQNIALTLDAIRIPTAEQDAIIMRYLSALRVPEHADSWPGAMSGGQRQRASIARALAIDPNVILMDEPFSALDELTARVLRAEIARLWGESSKTVVFVTHSVKEACFLADRIFVFRANPGRIHQIISVELKRPRDFDDEALLNLERSITKELLSLWGEDGGAEAVGVRQRKVVV